MAILDLPTPNKVALTSGDHTPDHNKIVTAIQTVNISVGEIALNVRDFGATGDGASDDTVACSAAITAAGASGTVIFPPGTYMVTGLSVTTAIRLVGHGATVKALPATAEFVPVIDVTATGDDAVIEGLRIDANGGEATYGVKVSGDRVTLRDLYVTGSSAMGVWGAAATDLLLDQCQMVTCGLVTTFGHAIYLSGCNRPTVLNCLMQDSYEHGLYLYGGGNTNVGAQVLGCKVIGNGIRQGANGVGLSIRQSESVVTDCVVLGNHVALGTAHPDGATRGSDVIISGCTLGWSVGTSQHDIILNGMERLTFTGNVIGTTDATYNIQIFLDCPNGLISGNQFSSEGNGVWVRDEGWTITGNKFTGPPAGGNALTVDAGVIGTEIKGNTFDTWSTGLYALVGASDYITAVDNTFRNVNTPVVNLSTGTHNIINLLNADSAAGEFNVKHYGAVGDDTADDTAEIQAALTAGAGKTVLIPAGTYKISGALTVSAGTTVTGTGTIRQMTAGTVGLQWTGSGITIEGITLRGVQSTNVYAGGEYAIYGHGTSAAARSERLRIRDVRIYGWGAYGLWLQYVTNFEVSGCHIHDIGYTGIGTLSGEEGRITNNRIDNITPGTSGNMYGIALTSGGGLPAVDPRSRNIVVDGNVVSRVGWEVIDTHGGENVVISNNTIFNCTGNAFALVGGPNDTQPTNISVTGNMVDSMVDTAPGAKQLAGLVYGNGAGYATGITITGNSFRRVEGLQTSYTKGMVIADNTFTEINACGVTLATSNFDFAITGNTFIDMWSDTQSTAAVSTTSIGDQTGMVANNRTGRGTKSATYINHFGLRIFINSVGRDIVASDNYFEDCGYPYGGEVAAIRMASGIYSVRDFGAKGDDTNNDLDAIQKALDAGEGHTVLFPKGVYRIWGYNLSVGAGTTVTGVGTIHNVDTGGWETLGIGGSNVTVENITLLGRHSTNTFSGGEYALFTAGGATAAAPLTNITIRNVKISKFGFLGIKLKYVDGFSITGCVVDTIGYMGIGAISSSNGVIANNRIDSIGPGTSSNMYGIVLTYDDTYGATNPVCEHIVVDGNIITNVNWEGIDSHGGEFFTIVNNDVRECRNALMIGGSATATPRNIIISGNHFENSAGSDKSVILVYGLSANYATNVVISNNVMRGSQPAQFSHNYGLILEGNTFVNMTQYAIMWYTNSRDFQCLNNTIIDVLGTSAEAITTVASAPNVSGTIAGNVLVDGPSVATKNAYGFSTNASSGVDIKFGFNDFSAATNDPINGAYGTTPAALYGPVSAQGGLAIVQPRNIQTGTSYTAVAADAGKLVTLNNTGAITVTLPRDSDAYLPVGTTIDFLPISSGMVTFVAGTGATVQGTSDGDLLTSSAVRAMCHALKRNTDTWLVYGSLV